MLTVMKKKRYESGRRLLLIPLLTLLFVLPILLSGCRRIGMVADPGDWGYSCEVRYDALGGVINQRELRTTYYEPGALLFQPSGSTNLLIQPTRDGYILAGWYTDKTDVLDKDGKIVGYEFNPQERWDFSLDRVSESMTLYARWLKQGEAVYLDAESGKILFRKSITGDSPVSRLGSGTLKMIGKPGYKMGGYFADQECRTEFDFDKLERSQLLPAEKELYNQLHEELPEIVTAEAYVAPPEERDEEGNLIVSPNPQLYINKLGFVIDLENEESMEKLRARKNEIIEASIQAYMLKTADTNIYIHYEKGGKMIVRTPEDLKKDKAYGFFSKDSKGNDVEQYILEADLDMSGLPFAMSEEFSGEIIGNGHTISNLYLKVVGHKRDRGDDKQAAIFGLLKGAKIRDLTIENYELQIDVPSTSKVECAALAVKAVDTELSNLKLKNLKIKTGKGDDGKAPYLIADLILYEEAVKATDVKVENLSIEASDKATITEKYK